MIAKYQQIAEQIKSQIENGEYQVKSALPAEAKLQEFYGVSRHTIRQAMAILVQEGYVYKEKGLGSYVSDEYIQRDKTSPKLIGVLVPYMTSFLSSHVLQGIEEVLRIHGYSLVFASTNGDSEQEKVCLKRLLELNVSGVIIEPTPAQQYNPNIPDYLAFKEREIPLLLIDAKDTMVDFPFIKLDDVKSGYMATQYLIERGRDKIGLCMQMDDNSGKDRLKGYVKAHEKNGLSFQSEQVYTYMGEDEIKVVETLVRKITQDKGSLDSVVCYNDKVANRLVNQLVQNGIKVPKDIAIVGHGDDEFSQAGPIGITTIAHPKEVLGHRAAKWILNVIEKNIYEDNIIFEPNLVIRQSV